MKFNFLPLIRILLASLIALPLSFPIASFGDEAEISPQTMGVCLGIYEKLNDYRSFKLKRGTGTAVLYTEDYSQFERTGCVVQLEGDYPEFEDQLPQDKKLFPEEDWREILRYAADGPGSGQMGFLHLNEEGPATFCLRRFDTGTTLDSPPAFYDLQILCVDASEEEFRE